MSEAPVNDDRAGTRLPKPAGSCAGRRAMLLGLAIFVSGCLVGGGAAVLAGRRIVRSALSHPETVPERLTARMRWSLDLDDRQERQVREILRRRHAAVQELRREMQPRVEAELESLRREVGGVLEPEQSRRWDDWYGRRHRAWMPGTPPCAPPDAAPCPGPMEGPPPGVGRRPR